MENRLEKKHYYYIIFILFIYAIWALVQPLNAGPDESMRYSICQYILNHGSLPHGANPEILNVDWGQSYAFTPILAYMLCVIPMKIVSIFTSNANVLWLAARMMNVILGIATVYLVIKIARLIFDDKKWQWLFIIFISCLPQFAFVFTYVNNDGLALFSSALIIYAWLIGFKDQWSYKSCTILAIGVGICALSYYNAYGYILMSVILFIGSMIYFNPHHWFKVTLTKGLYISLIAFILAGWWFIRNYLIYNGDFIGMQTSNYYAELYALPNLKPSMIDSPANLNLSLWDMLFKKRWLSEVVLSFIGRFDYMKIYPPQWFYYIFVGIGGLGFIGICKSIINLIFKEKYLTKLFNIGMFCCLIIPNLLNLYYSYFNDFQPQGRYSMPMIFALAYFIALGTKYLFDKFKWSKHYAIISCSACAFCLVYSLVFIIIPYYY